jgi:hypothetical protein
MLPQRDRLPRRYLPLLLATVLTGLALLLTGRPVRGGEGDKGANSLSLVPADAGFYQALLRNKEQLDAVLKSKAWGRLVKLPIVQMGLKKLTDLWGQEEGPLAPVRTFFGKAENKELLELLGDAVAHEVFFYGDTAWADVWTLLGQINNAQRFGSLGAAFTGDDPSRSQIRAALHILQQNRSKLKVPDLVLGFKLTNTKRAHAQVKRLEKLLTGAGEDVPLLKGKVHRTKVGDGSFLTLNLAGNMIPWEEIPLFVFQDQAGEFDDLVKHLKAQTLTVSLGVRADHLLLGIGRSAKALEKFSGGGKHLADRPEVKPLAKFAKEKIVSLSYASKDFNTRLAGASGAELDTLTRYAKQVLESADLPAARRRAIEKDLDALMKEVKATPLEAGATFGVSFLSKTGFEGYSYDFSNHDDLKGVKFSLLDHLGGKPILAVGGASKSDPQEYETFAKGIGILYGHVEDIVMQKLDEDGRQKYKEFKKAFLPLVKRFDQTTRKLLIPSLGDSAAFVIDAGWTSKQWLRSLPPTPGPMPMVELGVLLELRDPAKFLKALREYRVLFNDLYQAVRQVSPPGTFPEFEIPAAQTAAAAGGTLYFYNLPEEVGLDEQVAPTVGISKSLAAFTLSRKHAQRLLARAPLKGVGSLAAKRDLVDVVHFNWAGLIDAVSPWVELAVRASVSPGDGEGAGDEKANKDRADEIVHQVRVVLDVLKAFQHYTSVTYLEDGRLVTRSQTVIQDR